MPVQALYRQVQAPYKIDSALWMSDYSGDDLTGARCKRVACFRVPVDCCHCHNRMIGLLYGEKNCDNMLSRFHPIAECYGRTDGQTEFLYQYCAS